MNKHTLISVILAASGGLAAAEIQTYEQLRDAYPPVHEYDHTADLLAITYPHDPAVFAVERSGIANMPFEECLTLDIKQPGESPYALNVQFFHTNTWETGDSGLIAFYARTLKTENRYGASSLMLQYKPDYQDWRGHAESDLFLTENWTLVLLPFEVTIDSGQTPQSVLNFFLGGVDPHSFQLAEVRVLNFKQTIPVDALPRSKAYYPGIEPDAPWRTAAADRIEKHRKAGLEIRVEDSRGNPIPDAAVHLKLKRHRFGFGAAIRTPLLVSPDTPAEERRKYSAILTRSCSKITPTNAMKWRQYANLKHYMPAVIDWCREHDMTLRGHLFIWPGFERLPHGYDLYETDPAAFRRDLTDHIETFANLYPDAFSEWDVMNEPYTETDFMDLLGKEVVLEWFETARKANPGYLTYINDYGILAGNNYEHQNNYFDWITYLIENDAPLDGIGFQGHYTTPMPPELIHERIDRFAAFGKKMQITEFDFKHPDMELQARFFEDFVTLIYSHPQMDALVNWIFLEDDFRPEAALYRRDFTPTAMGKVWERLLTEDWHTEETRITDKNGRVDLRGFKGLYEIRIELNGEQSSSQLNLDDDLKTGITFP